MFSVVIPVPNSILSSPLPLTVSNPPPKFHLTVLFSSESIIISFPAPPSIILFFPYTSIVSFPVPPFIVLLFPDIVIWSSPEPLLIVLLLY